MTERHRAQEELAAQNEELTTLYRISELSLAAESLGGAMDDILEEVSRATRYPIVAIERYDAERDAMVFMASRGIPLPEDGEPLVIPVHKTLSGVAVQTAQAVVERDVRSNKRHSSDVFHDLGVQTYMAFPVVIGGDAVGTLTLAHPEALEPNRWVSRLATSLAHTIAGLMERIGAAEALRQSETEFRTLAGHLQQANDELEAFAYSISHDLRTPLRTMTGFAHALMETLGEDANKDARNFPERIIVSGAWAENLITDLLNYSRLTFEALELQAIDLKEVMASVLEQVGPIVKDLQADITVDGELPSVMAQKTILTQVLSNLVTNAAKFVPQGRTPEVRVRCEEREERIRIWVEDNGIGVPEGQEERIFGVFERLDQSSERPGTGIGLAIVRRGNGTDRRGGGSRTTLRRERLLGRRAERAQAELEALGSTSRADRPGRMRGERPQPRGLGRRRRCRRGGISVRGQGDVIALSLHVGSGGQIAQLSIPARGVSSQTLGQLPPPLGLEHRLLA